VLLGVIVPPVRGILGGVNGKVQPASKTADSRAGNRYRKQVFILFSKEFPLISPLQGVEIHGLLLSSIRVYRSMKSE
jgi:hypothetical protein